MRLVILGVGHVFRIGPTIESLILRQRPRAVCLELDRTRFDSLMHGPPGRREIPADAPAAYRRLAKFQEDMAEHFGAGEVGGEMRHAAMAARHAQAQLVLVDMEAGRLVRRIQEEMHMGERIRFFWELLKVRIRRPKAGQIEKEIERLETDPQAMIEELGTKFPTLKRILIDERNEHMAGMIRQAVDEHGDVVAVLGDGHVEGIVELLKDLGPDVHRLREIRRLAAGSVGPAGGVDAQGGGATVRFGYTVDWSGSEPYGGRRP